MPEDTKNNPYAHRWYRQKYKLGYGAEGAARGENHVGGDAEKVDPRADSDKASEHEEKEESGSEENS